MSKERKKMKKQPYCIEPLKRDLRIMAKNSPTSPEFNMAEEHFVCYVGCLSDALRLLFLAAYEAISRGNGRCVAYVINSIKAEDRKFGRQQWRPSNQLVRLGRCATPVRTSLQ